MRPFRGQHTVGSIPPEEQVPNTTQAPPPPPPLPKGARIAQQQIALAKQIGRLKEASTNEPTPIANIKGGKPYIPS